MNIAILCTHRNSYYYELAGTDCYDINRNCRTFTGCNPVIAHPPCRGWTPFGKAMKAKPRAGEKDLAYFCLERLIQNGGILEHPYKSEFVKMAENIPGLKTVVVNQSWFGMYVEKRTKLLMPDWYELPELPFILVPHNSYEKRYRFWANKDSSISPLAFCQWLIKTVRLNHGS